jgi:hypothetical protein
MIARGRDGAGIDRLSREISPRSKAHQPPYYRATQHTELTFDRCICDTQMLTRYRALGRTLDVVRADKPNRGPP